MMVTRRRDVEDVLDVARSSPHIRAHDDQRGFRPAGAATGTGEEHGPEDRLGRRIEQQPKEQIKNINGNPVNHVEGRNGVPASQNCFRAVGRCQSAEVKICESSKRR